MISFLSVGLQTWCQIVIWIVRINQNINKCWGGNAVTRQICPGSFTVVLWLLIKLMKTPKQFQPKVLTPATGRYGTLGKQGEFPLLPPSHLLLLSASSTCLISLGSACFQPTTGAYSEASLITQLPKCRCNLPNVCKWHFCLQYWQSWGAIVHMQGVVRNWKRPENPVKL